MGARRVEQRSWIEEGLITQREILIPGKTSTCSSFGRSAHTSICTTEVGEEVVGRNDRCILSGFSRLCMLVQHWRSNNGESVYFRRREHVQFHEYQVKPLHIPAPPNYDNYDMPFLVNFETHLTPIYKFSTTINSTSTLDKSNAPFPRSLLLFLSEKPILLHGSPPLQLSSTQNVLCPPLPIAAAFPTLLLRY